jgi:cytochrome P450
VSRLYTLRSAYFPFGGGPRQCIGNTFALTETILVTATIAQHYRLRLAPGAVVVPAPSVALRPRPGMPMLLQRREAVHPGPDPAA